MLFEEYIREERKEAFAEGRQEGEREGKLEGLAMARIEDILWFLQELGPIPEELEERIHNESDPEKLSRWLRTAAGAKTLEEFLGRL